MSLRSCEISHLASSSSATTSFFRPRASPKSAVSRVRCAAANQQHPEEEQPTRRRTLQSLVATLAAVNASSAVATASEDSTREGEIHHTDAEWRAMLSPDQYAVLRTAATERRNSNPLVDEHRTGTFLCGGCGSPVYTSASKYESGTGWPSFFDVIPGSVDEVADRSIPFMPRTEIRCHRCKSHLGHSFNDGPKPTGMRYCMNGVAMTFQPEQA